jgi:hypothetical protein
MSQVFPGVWFGAGLLAWPPGWPPGYDIEVYEGFFDVESIGWVWN